MISYVMRHCRGRKYAKVSNRQPMETGARANWTARYRQGRVARLVADLGKVARHASLHSIPFGRGGESTLRTP